MPVRAAPQRHLANRHAICVSGSDSYASLFLADQQLVPYRYSYHLVLVILVLVGETLFKKTEIPLFQIGVG